MEGKRRLKLISEESKKKMDGSLDRYLSEMFSRIIQ